MNLPAPTPVPPAALVLGDVVKDLTHGGLFVVDRINGALTIDVHDVVTKCPYANVPLVDVELVPNLRERR